MEPEPGEPSPASDRGLPSVEGQRLVIAVHRHEFPLSSCSPATVYKDKRSLCRQVNLFGGAVCGPAIGGSYLQPLSHVVLSKLFPA